MICFCLALALTVTSSLKADITIKGKEKVKRDTLIEMTVETDSKAEGVNWKVETLDRKKVKFRKVGKDIVFAAPPGSYYVLAYTNKLAVDKVTIITEEAEFVVTVEDDKPKPPPDPVDPVLPVPDVFGLIKASKAGKDAVTSPGKMEESKKIAQAQKTHAGKVAAGVYQNKADILEGWRARNIEATTAEQRSMWAPWAKLVDAKLSELDKAGKLKDNKAWSDAFLEIAEGLK